MKKAIIAIAVLMMMSGVVFSQVNFADGLAKAKTSGKKIIVNIYSDNDSWSQKMDKVYLNDKVNNLVNSFFIYVKLNGNGTGKINYGGKEYTESSFSKFLGATGFPTHIIMNSDGTIINFLYNGERVGAFAGYLDSGSFENFLRYFAENKYKDTDLSKVL